ncbi:efflux RND transporter periplasmic adaptor subunit [Roseicitreum antarcticum]|nr:efflux RND transporter periplasmic adaptor subunit [Roseicitreum antarcticum]
MRIVPLITALTITGSLYLLVMEREALLAFASTATAEDTPGDAAAVTADATGTEAPPRVAVVAQRTTASEVENTVLLRGRTEAARQVEIRAETGGLIASTPLRRGSHVTAGDPLCVLSPGTRQAALAEAEARLAEAEINFNAAQRLSEGGFASQTRAASARATLQGAQAGVEAATQELNRLTMVAPFDGLLETDTAELGALLQPGGLCATLIQLDPMKLVGFVPETQVDRIEIGTTAGARLSGGRDVLGRVSFLSRSADPATRTFRVEVTVPNADMSIRDGQSADMMISATGDMAHLIPGSALTLNNEGQLGLRLLDDDDIVTFTTVQVIRDTANGVWVGGLPDEATVIVLGQEYVSEGVQVDVTYRGNDAAEGLGQ